VAPLISHRGFTADVHPYMTTERTRHGSRGAVVLLALGMSFAFALGVLPSLGRTDTVDNNSSANSSQSLSYDFKVHALNCTSQTRTQNGTLFRFNAADLPFEFSTVYFGDYRSDTSYSHKYYGGSGILVNASGSNAVMVLRENGGRFVSRIDYHGQAQIVFNGKVESVTYPLVATKYDGTDQIIQDWRNRTWTPDDGVLVEHPSNVTLASAKFYLMTLEPSGTTDIPEFEILPIVGAVIVVFLAVRRSAARE